MELSQSDERFLVPDSEDEELNNCESWDLILGLKALAAARRQIHARQKIGMDEDQEKSKETKKPSIFQSCESEDNSPGPQAALVYETISENSSGSSKEKHNVTVIERAPSGRAQEIKKKSKDDIALTPSEHIGSLQISQQDMLVPETIESLNDNGPSPNMSLTGPFIVPDSPSQEIQASSSDLKDKDLEDDEVTFNPRILSTLASQSVDTNEGSQFLHLRLSPSQPDSMPSSGTPDRVDIPFETSSKNEPVLSTPIKNPQMSLSCRNPRKDAEFETVSRGVPSPNLSELSRRIRSAVRSNMGTQTTLVSIRRSSSTQTPVDEYEDNHEYV